jgi:hypothetical protein
LNDSDFRREVIARFAATEEAPMAVAGLHLLSPARVAQVLDVSIRTIRNELDAGRLPTTFVAQQRRIAVIDLVDYLLANRRVGTSSSDADAKSGLFPS